MAFSYYGAKHGLASKYPRPRFPLIIEPFAGAAGYSCYYATTDHDVWLNDLDQLVLATWRRIQTITLDELNKIEQQVREQTRTTDVLVASAGGSSAWPGIAAGADRAITPRMREMWSSTRKRIERVAPVAAGWKLTGDDYRDLPDVEATWLIDPPYKPLLEYTSWQQGAGNAYLHGSSGIDYEELGEWCRSRRGQVIVCEQSPAAWLPFTPFAAQGNGATNGATRTEVVWYSDQQQLSMW